VKTDDVVTAINRNGVFLAQWKIRYKVSVSESFELENFPFDTQDLTVAIEFAPDCLPCAQLQGAVVPRKVVVKEHILSNGIGWDLRSTEATIPHVNEGSSAAPLFLVIVKVERCWVPYCWNVLLVPFFIFDYIEDFGDRIGFLITLFLAAVAYQFVVKGDLPKLSYLSLIDKAIIAIFGLMSYNMLLLAVTYHWEVEGANKVGFWSTIVCIVAIFGDLAVLVLKVVTAFPELRSVNGVFDLQLS
jgi:hypothetical protein